MKNIVIVMVLMHSVAFGWEINTHRAIDKMAIAKGKASNLNQFLEDSKLIEPFEKEAINFDDYGMTYIEYILQGEKDGISNWRQKFTYDAASKKATIKDLIEAGTILEDAQWAGAWFKVYGRFLNHFADPQNNFSGLPGMTGADLWAWGSMSGKNKK